MQTLSTVCIASHRAAQQSPDSPVPPKAWLVAAVAIVHAQAIRGLAFATQSHAHCTLSRELFPVMHRKCNVLYEYSRIERVSNSVHILNSYCNCTNHKEKDTRTCTSCELVVISGRPAEWSQSQPVSISTSRPFHWRRSGRREKWKGKALLFNSNFKIKFGSPSRRAPTTMNNNSRII